MTATIYAKLETSAAALWKRTDKTSCLDKHVVALVGSALDLLCVSHWNWTNADAANAVALTLEIDQS